MNKKQKKMLARIITAAAFLVALAYSEPSTLRAFSNTASRMNFDFVWPQASAARFT